MSVTQTAPSKHGGKPTSPAQVLLLYIAGLLTLLLGSLVVFHFKIPFLGETLWDALFNGISHGLELLFTTVLPTLGTATAAHYTVLTGAVGVLWLTQIYLRVNRTGRVQPGKVDGFMLVLATWLYAVYWLYMGTTVTVNASFYARLALYSAISTVVFSLTVVLAWRADAMGNEKSGRADAKAAEENMGPFLFSLLLSSVSGLATGFYDGDDASVSIWTYQIPNALLHLGANAGGIVMALWFVSLVSEQAKPSASTHAVAGAHTENPAGEGSSCG